MRICWEQRCSDGGDPDSPCDSTNHFFVVSVAIILHSVTINVGVVPRTSRKPLKLNVRYWHLADIR
jgi:hypothetical protein